MKLIGCMSIYLRAEVALPSFPWHHPWKSNSSAKAAVLSGK